MGNGLGPGLAPHIAVLGGVHVPESLYCRYRDGGWNLIDERGYFSWCFLNRYLTFFPNVVFAFAAIHVLVVRRGKPGVRLWDGWLKIVGGNRAFVFLLFSCSFLTPAKE